MKKFIGKVLFGTGLGVLFLLPLFGWIAAEPVPYSDGEGFFTIQPPEGWQAEDRKGLGQGFVMTGAAGPAGVAPSVQLVHEPAGIVALDEQWLAHLGRLRYDFERVKFLSLEDHEESDPPYHEARYSYFEGEVQYQALVRLLLHQGRFYLLTGSSTAEEFENQAERFKSVFHSLQPGGK